MGDIFAMAAETTEEEKKFRKKFYLQKGVERKDDFLYTLFKCLSDQTGGHKSKVLKLAEDIEKYNKEKDFANQVKNILPILFTGEGMCDDDTSLVAWLRLLLWAGECHFTFPLLKGISPFVDKEFRAVRHRHPIYSGITLPTIARLWPTRTQKGVVTKNNDSIVITCPYGLVIHVVVNSER
jgi:hypothetical protein